MKSSYCENAELIERYRLGDESAKEEFINANTGLVKRIAHGYRDRGIEVEDLIEIGIIGLLKALDGFDPSLGYNFSTYAFPVISGEIKRALRDDGFIKVSRSIKKNASDVMKARQNFFNEKGREPKLSELCEICGLSGEEIAEAIDASLPPLSLQGSTAGDGEGLNIEDITGTDGGISAATDSLALQQAIEKLCDFERSIISLRYFHGLTQVQAAKILGITQVKVSRTEKKIIDKLRTVFL